MGDKESKIIMAIVLVLCATWIFCTVAIAVLEDKFEKECEAKHGVVLRDYHEHLRCINHGSELK